MTTYGSKPAIPAAVPSPWAAWPMIVASGAVVLTAALVAGGLNLAGSDGPDRAADDGVTRRLRDLECMNLVRQVVSRNRSMLEAGAFREAVAKAQVICAEDPAVFRRLIRQAGSEPSQ